MPVRLVRRCTHWLAGLFLLVAVAVSALSPTEQLRVADGLFARGLYDLALEEYLVLSRMDERGVALDVALFRIGECYRRLGQPEAAGRFYLRVRREHPDSPYAQRAQFRHAESLWLREDYAAAYEQFTLLLEQAEIPTALQIPARYYSGDAAYRLARWSQAATDWQAVLDGGGDAPLVAYAALDLARLYRAQEPERIHERYALYERAVALAPTGEVAAEAWVRKAHWYFAQGRYESSARAFDRLRTQWPDQPPAQAPDLMAAWAYYHVGRYADAVALAQERGALYPAADATRQRPAWLYLLANAQRRLLRTAEAQETYRQLLKDYPDHELAPVARYERTLLSFRAGQYEEAVTEMVGIEPDWAAPADVYWMLAESYAGLGRDNEAVQYYQLLLNASPGPERAAPARYQLARLLLDRDDYTAAARLFRELAERYPDHELAPRAQYEAGTAWALAEQADRAVREWTAFLERYPRHERAAQAQLQIGLARMKAGDDEAALAAFADLRSGRTPGTYAGQAAYWSAILQERAGHAGRAAIAWQDAIEQLPPGRKQLLAQYRFALNVQQQERFDEAAAQLQDLLAEAAALEWPPSLLDWLWRYQLGQGLYSEALAAARSLQALAAADADWVQSGAYGEGRAWLGLDRVEAAEAAFEQALAAAGTTRAGAAAAEQLGQLALAAGRRTAAATYFEQAVERAVDEEWADIRARGFFGLGRIAEERADWSLASRYYLAVSILFDDPNLVPEALYRGAQALQAAGREAERERAIEELRERYPDSNWTQQVDTTP